MTGAEQADVRMARLFAAHAGLAASAWEPQVDRLSGRLGRCVHRRKASQNGRVRNRSRDGLRGAVIS